MITKEHIQIIINAITNRGIMFVEEVPLYRDRITERWMLSEIIPYTMERLLCEDLEVEE